MAWLVKKYKNGKYGLWTTISDGWMTKPKALSKDEMIDLIVELKTITFNEEIDHLRSTFPQGWYDIDGKRIK